MPVCDRGVWGDVRKVPQPALRISCALTVVAAIYIGWHIHRWGTPKSLAADLGRANCTEFYRPELERQRDLLSSIWKWYFGPLVPGMALFLIYGFVAAPPGRRSFQVIYAMASVAFFWIIGWLNGRAAQRLNVQITDSTAS